MATLALSASMETADVTRVADRFAHNRPNKLRFIRPAETSTFGLLWPEALVRGLPASFMSDGPQLLAGFSTALAGGIHAATATRAES